jgi:hypothetical protein
VPKLGLDEVGKLRRGVERLGPIEGPDEAPALDRGEGRHARLGWNLVAARDLVTNAVGAVVPVVEGAADLAADDVAYAEIGTEVCAPRAHHVGRAVLPAPDDDAAVEVVGADGLPGGHFRRHRNGIPVLLVEAAPATLGRLAHHIPLSYPEPPLSFGEEKALLFEEWDEPPL